MAIRTLADLLALQMGKPGGICTEALPDHLRMAADRWSPGKRPVDQAGHPIGIVTVNPVTQRLPIHTAALRRLRSGSPVTHMRRRKHPAQRSRILHASRLPPMPKGPCM